jgi:hypothetical protein
MIPYKNLSGNSGVSMYEIGSDFIRVLFHAVASSKWSYEKIMEFIQSDPEEADE